jgi:hypothetical protein
LDQRWKQILNELVIKYLIFTEPRSVSVHSKRNSVHISRRVYELVEIEKDVSRTKILFCVVKWRKARIATHRYKMSTMLASQFDWEKVVPVHHKPPRVAYVDSVETALSVGDFVVVNSTILASRKSVVGRIIDIDKEREKCLLNWWNDPSVFPILSPHLPSISSTDFQFIVACSVPELLQSVDCCWIDASDVLNVAFVFHVESVGNCSFDCYGMRNAFFCRYRYRIQSDDDVVMEALSAATHTPNNSPVCNMLNTIFAFVFLCLFFNRFVAASSMSSRN